MTGMEFRRIAHAHGLLAPLVTGGAVGQIDATVASCYAPVLDVAVGTRPLTDSVVSGLMTFSPVCTTLI